MNINLSKKNKASGSIGFGLNSRGSSSTKKKKKKSNVFDSLSDDDDSNTRQGGDGGDDDLDTSELSGREQVNRQIAAEQAALRKRAQAAAAAIEDPSVYDYDGAYDAIKQEEEDAKEAKKAQDADRKSRYIGDLLKAAKKRERERDTIYERKVAKEQAEEDAKAEYVGKEKFITKAYKRKLEERKRWEAEEEQQRLEEEKNDVTKQTDGKAFGSFYANFSRNVSMGGTKKKQPSSDDDDDEREQKRKRMDNDDNEDSQKQDLKEELGLGGGGMGFLDGFERPDDGGDGNNGDGVGMTTSTSNTNGGEISKSENSHDNIPKLSMREIREKKVAEARVRYLERKRRQQQQQQQQQQQLAGH